MLYGVLHGNTEILIYHTTFQGQIQLQIHKNNLQIVLYFQKICAIIMGCFVNRVICPQKDLEADMKQAVCIGTRAQPRPEGGVLWGGGAPTELRDAGR